MLKSIDYTVTFSSTGRTLAENINFSTGFGTITGPNEAGKSFVVEMIRWALFGSSALRGKQSEMKKAKVMLSFEVKGVGYTVHRTTSNAKLVRGADDIAVGTTPVNEKLLSIFGYGLPVFDMANAANQGEIEALVSMKPAERKRLVDSVIGLGVIDDIGKIAGEEANTLKRLASDLAANTPEPEAPEKPEGYRPVDEVMKDIAALSEANNELQQLRGWLSSEPTQPTAPTDPQLPPVEQLEAAVNAHEALATEGRVLTGKLNSLPSPTSYTAERLEEIEQQFWDHRRWVAKKALLLQYPEGDPLSEEQLQTVEGLIDKWEEYQEAMGVAIQIAKLKEQGSHTCPSCTYSWPMASDAIAPLREKLDSYDIDTEATMAKPELTRRDIEGQRGMLKKIAQLDEALEEYDDVVATEAPELDEMQIESHRKRLGYDEERKRLLEDQAMINLALNDCPDRRADLQKRRAYDEALTRYKQLSVSYEEWQATAGSKRAKARLLEAELEQLPALQELKTKVVVYDTVFARYEKELERYTEAVMEIEKMRIEAEDWTKAKEALVNLRGMVKQHLMPSLNKVASFYLMQMTGGQRQIIHADEDFNITVDGQELNTLSGSGKAVACLALRLGLGQVLTNNVFSLFIGDEIDASMDKDRAENTALTLQTLKSRISQILLVTHKFPTADYYITVGNHNETDDPS